MSYAGAVSIRILPGQYYDAETGLHYNYHRYYDPVTGRYMSADPIGIRPEPNLYLYVLNNPIKWVDPFGLKCNMIDFSACMGMMTVGGLSYFCSRCVYWGELAPAVCGVCTAAILAGSGYLCYKAACPPDFPCVEDQSSPPPPGYYQDPQPFASGVPPGPYPGSAPLR